MKSLIRFLSDSGFIFYQQFFLLFFGATYDGKREREGNLKVNAEFSQGTEELPNRLI